MRVLEKALRVGVALAALGAPASRAAAEAPYEHKCNPAEDTERECARFIEPAFIASSSTNAFAGLRIGADLHSVSSEASAGFAKNGISQATVAAQPSFGIRIIPPYFLVYFGGDGGLSSGVNPGSLVGGGAAASGDFFVGTVLQVHGDNWRLALNGRLLDGRGYAIETEGAVVGVTQDFTTQSLSAALGTLAGAVPYALLPYVVTGKRLDLAAAYDWRKVTLQGALGVETTTQTFSPSLPNLTESLTTSALPRVGVAVGIAPDVFHFFELLVEYQVTAIRTGGTVSGPSSPSVASPPVTQSVVALGVYGSRIVLPARLQVGATVYGGWGGEATLLPPNSTASTVTSTPWDVGVIFSSRYLF